MDLIEVYRYIIDTSVADVAVQGTVHPFPHVGKFIQAV